MRSILIVLAAALGFAGLASASSRGDVLYTVPSASMEPTLHCAKPGVGCLGKVADRVLAVQPPGAIRRGSIVVFQTPPLATVRCGAGGLFIKRVIGLPGNKVGEVKGYVTVNGKRLREPYIKAGYRDDRTIAPVAVPAGSYWVLGDNRAASCDSRSWGMVPAKNVVGRVIEVIRPPG